MDSSEVLNLIAKLTVCLSHLFLQKFSMLFSAKKKNTEIFLSVLVFKFISSLINHIL